MTIEIPEWVLYVLGGVGGLIGLAIIVIILMFAFVGWMVMRSFK